MSKNYIIADETFEKLEWESLEASELPGELAGSCILGVETITDGIAPIGCILYLEKRSGKAIAVEMLWDNDENEFLIAKADIPNLRIDQQ